jgi:hypothetical protein
MRFKMFAAIAIGVLAASAIPAAARDLGGDGGNGGMGSAQGFHFGPGPGINYGPIPDEGQFLRYEDNANPSMGDVCLSCIGGSDSVRGPLSPSGGISNSRSSVSSGREGYIHWNPGGF